MAPRSSRLALRAAAALLAACAAARAQDGGGERMVAAVNVRVGETGTVALALGAADVEDLAGAVGGFVSQELLPRVLSAAREAVAESIHAEIPVQVGAGGESRPLRIYKTDSVAEAVGRFAAAHGLGDGPAKELLDQVGSRLSSAGAQPVAEVPVETAGGRALSLALHEGQTLRDAVDQLVAAHGIPESEAGGLLETARRKLVAQGLLPLAEVPVSVSGQRQVLALMAGEAVHDAVAKFASKHALGEPEAESLLAETRRVLTAKGLLPLADFTVDLTGGQKASLPLYAGEDHKEAVDRFAASHGIGPEAAEALRADVEKGLRGRGLLPVTTISVEVDGQATGLPLYAGDNSTEAVERFALTRNLGPEATQKLVGEVQRRLVAEGHAPLAQVGLALGERRVQIPVFVGDNVTEVAAAYGARYGVPAESLPALVREVRRSLVAQGVEPVSTFAVAVGEREVPLPVYAGEDLDVTVKRFASKAGLDDTQAAALRETLQTRLAAKGLLPVAEIPVKVDDRQTATLTLYEGEAVEEAVGAFAKLHGLDGAASEALTKQLQRRLLSMQLVPLVQFPVEAGGRTRQLPIYEGEDVPTAVGRFLAQAGLEGDQERRAALEADVTSKLQQRGLVPLLTVPFRHAGRDYGLPFYQGDSVSEQVTRFFEQNGLPGERVEEMVSLVNQRAQESRLMPVAEIPVAVKGRQALLPLFHGEDVERAVASWSAKNGLTDEDSRALVGAVVERLSTKGKAAPAEQQQQQQQQPEA